MCTLMVFSYILTRSSLGDRQQILFSLDTNSVKFIITNHTLIMNTYNDYAHSPKMMDDVHNVTCIVTHHYSFHLY